MKNYEFPVWIKIGTYETVETVIIAGLEKSEVELLRSILKEEDHESFYECHAALGIYKRIHALAKMEIAKNPDNILGIDGADHTGNRLVDIKYPIYIEYPESLGE